jgi:hypothetical protein
MAADDRTPYVSRHNSMKSSVAREAQYSSDFLLKLAKSEA